MNPHQILSICCLRPERKNRRTSEKKCCTKMWFLTKSNKMRKVWMGLQRDLKTVRAAVGRPALCGYSREAGLSSEGPWEPTQKCVSCEMT